jgi:hypothetical protein
MALTLKDRALRARNAEFVENVLMAAVANCNDVYAEPLNTLGHAERAAFASRLSQRPDDYKVALAICISANISVDVPADANIKSQVILWWNCWSGANLTPPA